MKKKFRSKSSRQLGVISDSSILNMQFLRTTWDIENLLANPNHTNFPFFKHDLEFQ